MWLYGIVLICADEVYLTGRGHAGPETERHFGHVNISHSVHEGRQQQGKHKNTMTSAFYMKGDSKNPFLQSVQIYLQRRQAGEMQLFDFLLANL